MTITLIGDDFCFSFIKFKTILQVKKKNSTIHQKRVSFYKNHWSGKNISSLNSIFI